VAELAGMVADGSCGTLFLMAGRASFPRIAVTVAAALTVTLGASRGMTHAQDAPQYVNDKERLAAIRRGHVWAPTNVPSMDIRTGPAGPGAFPPNATVTCNYVEEKSSGKSAKFTCVIPPDDKIHVKYGRTNGEVFAEVAASRLFWALGFGAEHDYPVRLECRGCPATIVDADFGTIQRLHPGRDIQTRTVYGWSWAELDEIESGAPPSERDARSALKLLAVLVQHTDSKTEQQRLLCPDDGSPNACPDPLLMVHDLGKTFGQSDLFNRDSVGSVNLHNWANSPIWKDPAHCVGGLAQSQTGTLGDPIISEGGRRFLADLLVQLTDTQIHDLFDVARFSERTLKTPGDASTIDEWVGTFKAKRDEIVTARCPS
jgi:hypothetical protein